MSVAHFSTFFPAQKIQWILEKRHGSARPFSWVAALLQMILLEISGSSFFRPFFALKIETDVPGVFPSRQVRFVFRCKSFAGILHMCLCEVPGICSVQLSLQGFSDLETEKKYWLAVWSIAHSICDKSSSPEEGGGEGSRLSRPFSPRVYLAHFSGW